MGHNFIKTIYNKLFIFGYKNSLDFNFFVFLAQKSYKRSKNIMLSKSFCPCRRMGYNNEKKSFSAACFVETAFNHLSSWIRYALGTTADDDWRPIAYEGNKILDNKVDGMKKGHSEEDTKDIDTVVAKAKEIVSDLYNKDVYFNYAPIGTYIIGKSSCLF